MNPEQTETPKPERPAATKRPCRSLFWAVGFLLVVLVFSFVGLPDVARQIEFRLARFDACIWQSCAGDTTILRSPRRKMAIDAIHRHLTKGTSREQVLQTLGEPESRWPDGKAFSYWLGYPRLFHGLDGDRLHVYFDDTGRVSKAKIVDD